MEKKIAANEQLFRDYPVWKSIAMLAVPSLLSILVMIFYNMADTFFIAQLGIQQSNRRKPYAVLLSVY